MYIYKLAKTTLIHSTISHNMIRAKTKDVHVHVYLEPSLFTDFQMSMEYLSENNYTFIYVMNMIYSSNIIIS